MTEKPFNVAQAVVDMWLAGFTCQEMLTTNVIVIQDGYIKHDMHHLFHALDIYMGQSNVNYSKELHKWQINLPTR